MLIEFSMERRTPCIPACSPVIVLCTITLASHKSTSHETNLDYSRSNQADWKYLWFQQWKLLLYFYDAIRHHLPSMYLFFFLPYYAKKSQHCAMDVLCSLVWVSQLCRRSAWEIEILCFLSQPLSRLWLGKCWGTVAAFQSQALMAAWGSQKEFLSPSLFCCQSSFATSLFSAKQLWQAVRFWCSAIGGGDNDAPVLSDLGGLVYSKPTKKLHRHRLWLNWMIKEIFRAPKGSCMQQNLEPSRTWVSLEQSVF